MRLYLETSVPNFLYATDAPDKRAITRELFDQIRQGTHLARVSSLYLEEVARTEAPLLRYLLEGVPTIYRLEVLPFTKPCRDLAELYVKAQAFTTLNWLDACHVATAAHHGCEAVVSWNFQHIVRAWTMKLVAEVHQAQGLAPIVLCSPMEVIGHD
ncbi:MAG: PIN domain-containing protein [Candidatus Eremiobacterota bacterium]